MLKVMSRCILPAVRLLAIILLAIAAAGCVASSSTAGATRPTLRVSDDSPAAFRGSGFRANEHVKVVAAVMGGARAVQRVTAGAGGRFVIRFRGMNANSCRGFVITAVGDRGSRATFKRAPGQCPAP
jgi:hypothetical protein